MGLLTTKLMKPLVIIYCRIIKSFISTKFIDQSHANWVKPDFPPWKHDTSGHNSNALHTSFSSLKPDQTTPKKQSDLGSFAQEHQQMTLKLSWKRGKRLKFRLDWVNYTKNSFNLNKTDQIDMAEKLLSDILTWNQGWAVETTPGFNQRLKPAAVNKPKSGQYWSWSIENLKGPFCVGLRYFYRFYVLSIEKRINLLFRPCKGHFSWWDFHLKTLALSSELQSNASNTSFSCIIKGRIE